MIFGHQTKPIVELQRMKGFLFIEKIDGLYPGNFPFCDVSIEARGQRESVIICESVQF